MSKPRIVAFARDANGVKIGTIQARINPYYLTDETALNFKRRVMKLKMRFKMDLECPDASRPLEIRTSIKQNGKNAFKEDADV